MRYARDSFLGRAQAGDAGYALEHVAWDPIARIEVSRVPAPDPEKSAWPSLFGPDRGLLSRFRLVVTQNNNAFTYAPDTTATPPPSGGWRGPSTPPPTWRASSRGRASSSWGWAGGSTCSPPSGSTPPRSQGSRSTGPRSRSCATPTASTSARGWTTRGSGSSTTEGRHFLARGEDRFDVIQLSGVDSVSGTPGAAHVFSESYLYTAEAIDLYLSRLAPDGVLNVMRPESIPPREMLRLVATVVDSLRRRGRRAARRPRDGRRRPEGDVRGGPGPAPALRAGAGAARRRVGRLEPVSLLAAAPGFAPSAPSPYAALLATPTARDLDTGLRRYPWDVLPVTDDRPFFFRTSRWSHLWPPPGRTPGPRSWSWACSPSSASRPRRRVAFVYVPLRGLRRRGEPGRPAWPRSSARSASGTWRSRWPSSRSSASSSATRTSPSRSSSPPCSSPPASARSCPGP